MTALLFDFADTAAPPAVNIAPIVLPEPPPPPPPPKPPAFVFPTYVRTKGEALALAEQLFPKVLEVAVERQRKLHPPRPDDRDPDLPPFFWVEQQMAEDLRKVFEWLFDDKTRIYKRARFHLFYQLVARFMELGRANREAVDRYYDQKHWRKQWAKEKLAHVLRGDGEGI